MIAEPAAFHDKYLVGNGEACKHCGGSGRTKGARGPATSRRCKPCKGTGRGALPAEVIVANTRPARRQAELVQAAREAREAAETLALHEEVEARATAAAQSVEVICGIPLPVQFGMRDDETMWISCGVPLVAHLQFDFPGTPRAASAYATLLNGLPAIREALQVARSECRDPDTDAGLSNAAGDLIENALRILGERL